MSFENPLKKAKLNINIPSRLTSRKWWGAIITTLIVIGNAWFIAGRPLINAEIASIAAIWGIYNYAEGRVDSERAKRGN